MRPRDFGVLLGATVGLSACGTVFRAEFDADSLGAPPLHPAGIAGQSLQTTASVLPAPVNISGDSPLSGSHSLLIFSPDRQPQVYMAAVSIRDSAHRVRAGWTQFATPNVQVVISFFGGHYDPFVMMRFENGRLNINGSDVGACASGESQTVLLAADPASHSYTASIFGRGCNISAAGATLAGSAFPNQQLGLQASLTAANNPSGYLKLDSVIISEDTRR